MSSREHHDDLRQVDGHESWRETCWLLGVDPDQHDVAGGEDVSR